MYDIDKLNEFINSSEFQEKLDKLNEIDLAFERYILTGILVIPK